MKIRSITLFADLAPQLDQGQLAHLGALAATARQAFEAAGYVVQTTRLAMHLFPALADSPWAADPAAQIAELEAAYLAAGFEFIALGPAGRTMRPHLADILRATQATFVTTALLDANGAIDGAAVHGAARVILQAAHIAEGFGNLRFAALANVAPGTPFFPAAYHGGGAPRFAVATEAADLAVLVCASAKNAEQARARLTAAIEQQANGIVAVAKEVMRSPAAQAVGRTLGGGLAFGGIDFSLAPYPDPAISIGAALEALSGEPLGCAGTLAAAATLTVAIAQARFPKAGFCGLMLPVLEDPVLARRAAEGRLGVGELLQWSAVCGTGLDTVPLPGDVSEAAVARLLYDVAALSMRLHKPLTARLMPLPGKVAGDAVHFDFAYFADGGVLALESCGAAGLLLESEGLHLGSREGSPCPGDTIKECQEAGT